MSFCRGSVLDTVALPGLVNLMAAKGANLDSAVKDSQKLRAKKMWSFVRSCVPMAVLWQSEDVSLPMYCMLQTISKCMLFLGMILAGEFHGLESVEGHTMVLEPKFDACWCPRQIAEVHSSSGVLPIRYIAALIRNPKFKDHTPCIRDKCSACQTDPDDYVRCHTTSCTGCVDISADEAKIIGLINQNLVPRISVAFPGDDLTLRGPELSVRGEGPYVAISHV